MELRVGMSNSLYVPSGSIRTSLFASWSVPHTVPRSSTATPNGAAFVSRMGYGVSCPPMARVKLLPQLSANHTAPSGATASRPSWASGPGTRTESSFERGKAEG